MKIDYSNHGLFEYPPQHGRRGYRVDATSTPGRFMVSTCGRRRDDVWRLLCAGRLTRRGIFRARLLSRAERYMVGYMLHGMRPRVSEKRERAQRKWERGFERRRAVRF